jgi:type IV secretory pathway TraG/TraD family ATPase VirD4
MLNTRIIRMQRMLLMRLMMLAKNRNQLEDQRIIRVLADEFRVHISRPFIVGLAAAAGWRLLVILAMQSFEDLRDCPADLDQDMVRGAVIENCALQLSYRIKDHNTAELLAMTTGEILVDDESRQIERNVALAETVSGMRSVRQADRYLVDVNMIKSLPVPDPDKKTIGCGVLVGASKLAQFCFTSPVKVERTVEAITPTTPKPPESELTNSVEDKISKIEPME